MRRLLVLPAALLAALGLLSAAQGGSFPGSNGLIAFTCGGAICTATEGSVYGAPLISSGANPAWSPSGAKLVYEKGSPSDVWTASADGNSQVLFESGASQATWWTDNTTVVFVKNSDNHIWAKSGSTETQLTNVPGAIDGDPSFSPDGTKLAFEELAQGDSYYHIWIGTYSGGALTNLIQLTSGENEGSPSTAPGTLVSCVSVAPDFAQRWLSLFFTNTTVVLSVHHVAWLAPGSNSTWLLPSALAVQTSLGLPFS